MLVELYRRVERRLARAAHRQSLRLDAAQSAVCFTFDDVPKSACVAGARIVEGCGGVATYFVCGGFEGRRDREVFFANSDLRHLQQRGHEIASHGFGHIDYQQHSLREVAEDIAKNDAFLQAAGLGRPRQFAFPFGSVSPRSKEYCAGRFAACRGVENQPNCAKADSALLKAVHLYEGAISREKVDALLADARKAGTWLIFLTHAVTESPGPFDTTPDQLGHAVSAALRHGLPILTMSQALHRFETGR